MTLEESLKTIVVQQTGCDYNEIHLTSELMNDLSADSLDIVGIVCDAEKTFIISIPDDEAEKIITFGHLLDLVKDKVNNGR